MGEEARPSQTRSKPGLDQRAGADHSSTRAGRPVICLLGSNLPDLAQASERLITLKTWINARKAAPLAPRGAPATGSYVPLPEF